MSLNKLSKECEECVTKFLEDYKPILKTEGYKIIHDPLFGTQKFENYEVAVLDSPLLQRLRYIKQMGFCYLLYPAAQHTRFEHSLGVTDNIEKLLRNLQMRYPRIVDKEKIITLRMTAILHDVGQCPFSHDSEELLSQSKAIEKLQKYDKFKGCKPHEILSYLIVNSKSFQDFLGGIERRFRISLNKDVIGDLIIGFPPNKDNNELWMASLINGIVDTDKLDYLRRDSYYTGLPVGIDIDRIIHTLKIEVTPDGRDLVPDQRSLPAIEQILFNKIFLYSTVYHHHKTRTGAQMFLKFLEKCDNYTEFLENPFRLLQYNDSNVITGLSSESNKKIGENLIKRKLLKRGIIISEATIEPETIGGLTEFKKLSTDTNRKKELEDKIKSELGCESIVDVPTAIEIPEASQTYIDNLGQIIPIGKIFPLRAWLERYRAIKWRGHIFIPARYQNDDNFDMLTKILNDEFGLEFKDTAKPF